MDQASGALTLTPLARMKLNAELMRLVRDKVGLSPTDSMAAFKAASIASKIMALLAKLGADTGVKRRELAGTALEGGPEPVGTRTVTARFYDFDPDRKQAQRKRDNDQAMELLRTLDGAKVNASQLPDEQRAILAKYSGTGGNLVGADGKKGSAYEYYTPIPIATAIWDLMVAMGFKGGKTLDPCSGTGIFGAAAPANAAIEAVELNETAGRVNQLVNGGPGYNAIISPFEAVAARTADEIYDAVVSNVPFGGVHDRGSNRKIDPKYQDQPLETYFILRSLEKLKPGGLAAFIVPPRVVGAKGGREEQLRIAASYMAEFRGAYRLPNSVFGTADADTMTDVIVFRKFSRDLLRKIAELREQNPALLVQAGVQWPEFIGGMYFQGEGRRFVLGEFQAKDPNKFRDVDRVISDQSVANIAKLLQKLPDSRIDWKLLEATETEPIVYNEGDTITLAGQTLEMRAGVWVALGRAAEDDRFDGLGQALSTATVAVTNKVAWTQADEYVLYLRGRSQELDMPMWLRAAHRDVSALDAGDRVKYWGALAAGLAAIEATQQHSSETGFNYLDAYPAVSEALQAGAAVARKAPAKFSRDAKAALQKVGIVYDRKTGFSAIWRGDVTEAVQQALSEDAQVAAAKYSIQSITLTVATLKTIFGDKFDPLQDDGWCVSADGTSATKADDYYTGNYAAFLARIDAEIAAATGAVRDKLLRQKQLAGERLNLVDPGSLRFNLFSPFVDIEEKAEFLRRFMDPRFVVAYDDEGRKVIICDISSAKTERDRQLKRFAEYLKRGNLSTRTSDEDMKANPNLDASRRKMLKGMVQQANAQFDQWVKSNPLIMDRLNRTANDPARLYFNEVDDTSPLGIEGMHPDFRLHGYQNAFTRKQARSFGGINGFDVGLGKTATALACVLYVQNIGVKKKTIFVVPNTVLTNWRKEVLLGDGKPGDPKYRPPVYASGEGCLFVGLDVDPKTGKASVDPANYARDLNRVLENKHNKIFMTLEAFKLIPVKDETVERYDAYLASVDKSYAGSERKADDERAESKRSEATTGTGAKSSAIPYLEDMGVDSLVGDEGHMFKNSKNTVEFSGAKFLSVAEASQRGLDVQIKAWFIRSLSANEDGVLILTATPITNSPLEIYSMLCLAAGERKVHNLCMGAEGADEFMNVMCQIEDDEEVTIDGRVKPYRVFRGLQNVDLLRNALATIATIKTGADVKEGGDDLKLPEAPENRAAVQLTPAAEARLNEYKMAYRAARYETGAAGKNADKPTADEFAALARVAERFGEQLELIAHPFNLINKMSLLIADPELDERATFYTITAPQAERAQQVIDVFNKLGKVEARALPGPHTDADAVVGTKTVKDGDSETILVKIKVRAKLTGTRIVLDSMDTNVQGDFEAIADKQGLDLDCAVPPKLAALLENVRREEGNPRSVSGRVKQLIFCDILSMHNKIKRLLVKHAGFSAASIAIVSGQSIKNAEQMQGVQDGFNAEGEDNKYRSVIANEKAEVGINLQKGTQAIHHLTIGWTPDSQQQRNGRGVRQGNTTTSVNIYHYDANGTFDEYKRTLTSKKSDWISAVMDRQGGNDVAVSGGLTNDQYNELIESMGDASAIQAIRDRAALLERQKRADSARARQVVNLQTVASQRKFIASYGTANAWAGERVLAIYDLREALDTMRRRARGHVGAATLIKLEARIAETAARLEGEMRELQESVVFKDWRDEPLATEAVLVPHEYDKTPAKKRERVQDNAKRLTVHAGSAYEQDWQSETAVARSMIDEAFKDFNRIAASPEGGYPAEMIADGLEGVAILDGRLYARGVFVRDPEGRLAVMLSGTVVTRFPGNTKRMEECVREGWTFIYPGSQDYEAALVEAATIDDGQTGVEPRNRDALFCAIVPAVGKLRKIATLLTYRFGYVTLPAPYFPWPVAPNPPTAMLRDIAASQAAVVQEWAEDRYGRFTLTMGDDVDATDVHSPMGCIEALRDHAIAIGQKVTMDDCSHLLYGNDNAVSRGAIVAEAKFPAGVGARLEQATNAEELTAIQNELLREAYTWFDLPADAEFGEWAPLDMVNAANRRLARIKIEEAEREAAANADAGSTMTLGPWTSRSGENRVYFDKIKGGAGAKLWAVKAPDGGWALEWKWGVGRPGVSKEELQTAISVELVKLNSGAPVRVFDDLWKLAGGLTADTAVLAADIELPGGVVPNARGLIGITGETRPNKDAIKECAVLAGGAARWNRDTERWEVPARTWSVLTNNYPDAARVLQPVPV